MSDEIVAKTPGTTTAIDAIDRPKGTADSTAQVYRLFAYLESKQGHEIANATVKLLADALGMVDGFKKAALQQSTLNLRFEKVLQLVVIVAVLIAVSGLTYFDKFNSPVALLLGTLVGYAFGRK